MVTWGFKEQGSIPEPELRRRAAFKGKTLQLMAWNVGGLRAFLKSRIADLQQAVKLGAPDVFGIMEHKLTDSQLALEFAGKNVELWCRTLHHL